jgi:hypothetical protein
VFVKMLREGEARVSDVNEERTLASMASA